MKKMQLRDRRIYGLCWGWCFLCGTMFLLVCFLLARCDGQSTKNSVTYCQWQTIDNIKIRGGDPQRVVASMSECQSICEGSTTCKGFEWSANGAPDYKCMLHTNKSTLQTAKNVLHYAKGNCRDCLWYGTYNFHNSYREIWSPDLYTCQKECIFRDDCQNMDWWSYSGTSHVFRCALGFNRSEKTSWLPGFIHFDFSCSISFRWIRVDDTQIIGGTVNPANDITTCKSACFTLGGCKGVDWTDYQDPGKKCYLLFTHDGRFQSYGFTHFDLFYGTDCQWRRMDGWQIIGGTVNPATDIDTCKNTCLEADGCKGVDWAFYNNPGQKCSLLFKNDGKSRKPGVTHFDLFFNAANW